MELMVKPYEQGEIEWNYDEIKSQIVEKVKVYGSMVYTESDIKAAKADRAELNKLKKALNDERISLQKQYMKPFDSFKAKVDELIKIIDEPVSIIDAQVKEYEAKKKEEKEKELRALFEEVNTIDWLTYDKIANPKWLNASTSIESIKEEMSLNISLIESQYSSLDGFDYEFEAREFFKRTLSLADTMGEIKRLKELAAKKAELEKPEAEEIPFTDDSPKEWMILEMNINVSDFEAFEKWAASRKIEWRMR